MTNRWRRFVWLSIGIDYQYQSIDKLVSIGCRLTEPESTHKKHNFVRSTNYKLYGLFVTVLMKNNNSLTQKYVHVVAEEDPQARTVGGRAVHDGSQL